MKLSLMTLGCPTWDLETIVRRAVEYGFDGLDFRGLRDELDITVLPEFTRLAARTRRLFADAGLEVCTISSSIRLCDRDGLPAHREEAKRTIGVAMELGVPNVRVFGDGDVEGAGREEAVRVGAETVETILGLDSARALRWLLETHDHWVRAADCALLLRAVEDPAFGALWDMGHTSRAGGETPEQTYRAIGPRVGYVHLKDAIYAPGRAGAMADGWRYVPCGSGSLPLAEGVSLLRANGYDGWIGFEHEKRWHPGLPDPEEAFPQFVAWFRGLESEEP